MISTNRWKLFFSILLFLPTWMAMGLPSGMPDLIRRNDTGLTDVVSWDAHSMFISGQRVFVLSAEFHPWRLPGNPDLWLDIFQKIKANGFNTVSFYINWAVHYPTPSTGNGQGDFQSNTYRDIQLFIDGARKAGLWLIARPGPYINGETTGGGFPGWVGNIQGSLRTNNAAYLAAYKPYLIAISRLIAKNQITQGGPIIMVQAENEFNESSDHNIYMQNIIDTYRSNGIVVPITHNDQHAGQAGNFSPDKPGLGRVNIYCGDSYPQGSSSWAQVQAIYYSAHQSAAPSNPLCLAEFGGGFLINWGAGTRGGTGFEKFSNDLTNAAYENVFYKENYAQTTTILNIYMLFGGTNWGQTAAPVSYTSYDYGGGINENRVATPKMNEMRLQGLFLRVSRDLLSSNLIANGTNYTTSSLIHTAELRNPSSGAAFYVTRHDDSRSTALTTTQLRVSTSVGSLVIPQTGVITFNGRDSKIIVTDYTFGRTNTKVLYSTAEIMTWTTIDNTDYIVLYAGSGEAGETAILLPSTPQVDLSNAPNAKQTFTGSRLVLNYNLIGSQFIRVSGSGTSLVVILLEKLLANQWNAPLISGGGNFGNYFSVGTNQSVLVSGPYLVRTAAITGNSLSLSGDLNGTTDIEFIAPASVSQLVWNDSPVSVTKTSRGSLKATIASNGTFTLPTLQNWRVVDSLPEINPNFDDSAFTLADQTTTNYTNLPPLSGRQVLYSQQYGFYGGNLIFRGRFNASGSETAVNLTVQYGFAGGYSAWLNGVFLGSAQGSSTVSSSTNVWTFPSGSLKAGGENVIVVVQDHTGITETNTNGGKEPRGIRGYSLVGGNTVITSWKIQGNQGGAANTPDTFRGYLNEGGLYAERIGAHLPGFPDTSWSVGSPLSGISKAGINFYRTMFDLAIPSGLDVPVRLSFTPSVITSNYRVQIYLNGWQVGKYFNSIGYVSSALQTIEDLTLLCSPQTVFVLPAGILRRHSTNTLALSLWSLDRNGASLSGLQLIADGIFSTAIPFNDYEGSDYAEQKANRPVPL
ncbi:glycoside hydrolase family 35 protein [Marasmius fiardii PR-910]|nr:glycoside hydrolase family 35 protein [Marasmius fiardii PR-910]